MPDPGDPYGRDPLVVIWSQVNSTDPPTPLKPWFGGFASVPAFLNGCAVVAAVAVPTPAESGHWFRVVLVDNGKQGGAEGDLIVALISLYGGYRIRSKAVGYGSYADAVADMLGDLLDGREGAS